MGPCLSWFSAQGTDLSREVVIALDTEDPRFGGANEKPLLKPSEKAPVCLDHLLLVMEFAAVFCFLGFFGVELWDFLVFELFGFDRNFEVPRIHGLLSCILLHVGRV